MDLHALRIFQAVARHQHLSRAAQELRIAQPSVSRVIARLEHELGTPLFHRGGRLRLNDYGLILQRHTDRALGELEAARRALDEAREQGVGSVSIASETLLTLTGVIAAFRNSHPHVTVRLLQSPAAEMTRLLEAGEVDLCVSSQPLTGDGLRSQEILREDVLLAVPAGHRLAGREKVTPEEIAQEPVVTARPGHWLRILLDRLLAARGLTAHIVCESDEAASLQALISSGLGVGLIPEVSRRSGSDIVAPVTWASVDAPDCERVLRLSWREGAHLSPAGHALHESIATGPVLPGSFF
ncbi:HTH-type transcriptional regulator GltC [Streptomyces sp. YIM 130001]|uniref:LysR family transcriptional regulator n=1 Tax=Streptomyces sp. YIM 130001 TaxID=2259644 RepID=UPI000E65DA7D|nr:LysR family transcriptional regulator [Streptomyces sp. YIM 130001]RII18401.1 HTH-type transcriptional regulator GltC [Streptomyces sp. YIM 130001]